MKHKKLIILLSSILLSVSSAITISMLVAKRKNTSNEVIEVNEENEDENIIENDSPIKVIQRQVDSTTYQLIATVDPENQSEDFIWSSSHENLIKIDAYNNTCLITKNHEYRGYVVINLNVGSLNWQTKVFCNGNYEITNATLKSSTLKSTSKGYYSTKAETININYSYTSPLFSTTYNGYLNDNEIDETLPSVDYSLSSITSKVPTEIIDEINSFNLDFMKTLTSAQVVFDSSTKEVTTEIIINVSKSTNTTFDNGYFTINFIEYIAPITLTVNVSEISI